MKGYSPEAAPSSTDNKFQAAQYKDVPFTVLFFTAMIAVVLMTGVGWNQSSFANDVDNTMHNDTHGNSTNSTELDIPVPEMAGVLVTSVVSGSAVAGFWLVVLKTFPKQMIYGALFAYVAYLLVFAAIMAYMGVYVGAFIFFIMACVGCGIIYWIRNKIPFAAAMLEAVIKVVIRFPASIGLSFASIVVMAITGVLFAVAMGVAAGFDDPTIQYVAMVFTMFCWFWAAQVIKNTVHVSCSGVYATWYFCMNNMPRNPTVAAFKRSVTTAFGSICFGSLIIAIIQTIRMLLNSGKNNKNGFVRACVECLLKLFEDMVKFFNVYAFTQVAIYGKSYCEAAKDTWAIFMDRGIHLIINDNVIGLALGLTVLLAGLMNGVVGFVLGAMMFNFDDELVWVIISIILAFLIGVFICLTVLESVSSGVACMFVCYAEAPEVLATNLPELNTALSSAYGDRLSLAAPGSR